MATTRTLEEVLASEWSLTAWPKCLVMPKRKPFVKIHAPGEGRTEISLSYVTFRESTHQMSKCMDVSFDSCILEGCNNAFYLKAPF